MLTGGLVSQLVEFVGGVESHRRELPQCRGVELDVGRSNARMSFDCVTGDLPPEQDDATPGELGLSPGSPTPWPPPSPG
jgi:hypothetical protein